MTNEPPVFERERNVTVGEVCDIQAGVGFPLELQGRKKGRYPFFKVGDISAAWKRGDRILRVAEHYLDAEELRQLRVRPLPAGATVFAKIGAAIALNRRAMLSQESLVDNNVMGLVPDERVLDGRYLYWCSTTWRLGELARATTVPSLRKGDIASLPIRLPPLTEQRRVVAALEEHLSDLDTAVAELDRAKVNTERYREALRDAAASGRLEENGSISSPFIDGEVPAGWRWTTVGECAAPEKSAITDGPFGSKLKTEHYVEDGPRVIRLQNIGRGTFVDALARISANHFATLQKHRVHAGDVVIAALGETLPRACVIPAGVGPAIVKADCIRFKPDPTVLLSDYASIALNAEGTRRRVTASIHGVGRPRLNLTEVRAIRFLLPPLSVQQQVILQVEGRFAVADRIAADVDVQLLRAARLRRSILKRAFEGRLVPQDPEDDPASTPIERVHRVPLTSVIPPRAKSKRTRPTR